MCAAFAVDSGISTEKRSLFERHGFDFTASVKADGDCFYYCVGFALLLYDKCRKGFHVMRDFHSEFDTLLPNFQQTTQSDEVTSLTVWLKGELKTWLQRNRHETVTLLTETGTWENFLLDANQLYELGLINVPLEGSDGKLQFSSFEDSLEKLFAPGFFACLLHVEVMCRRFQICIPILLLDSNIYMKNTEHALASNYASLIDIGIALFLRGDHYELVFRSTFCSGKNKNLLTGLGFERPLRVVASAGAGVGSLGEAHDQSHAFKAYIDFETIIWGKNSDNSVAVTPSEIGIVVRDSRSGTIQESFSCYLVHQC